MDVLYLMRPTVFNLQRVLADYERDVEPERKDLFERFFPCIFRGIPRVEPEPAWYADWRLCVLPSVPSRSGGPFDYRSARDWLDSQADARGAELDRLRK